MILALAQEREASSESPQALDSAINWRSPDFQFYSMVVLRHFGRSKKDRLNPEIVAQLDELAEAQPESETPIVALIREGKDSIRAVKSRTELGSVSLAALAKSIVRLKKKFDTKQGGFEENGSIPSEFESKLNERFGEYVYLNGLDPYKKKGWGVLISNLRDQLRAEFKVSKLPVESRGKMEDFIRFVDVAFMTHIIKSAQTMELIRPLLAIQLDLGSAFSALETD